MGFPLASVAVRGMLRRMDTTDSSRLSHPDTSLGNPLGLRLSAVAVAALATMALAAGCGSSTSSSGAKNAAASTVSAAAAGSATSSSGAVDGGASPSAAGSGAGSGTSEPPKPTDPGAGGPHDCSTDMLSFKIQPVREPINHVLLSATNISRLPCHLNKYPMLRTVLSQAAIIKPEEATRPAGQVLLAPGATAYAGIMTNSADGSGVGGKNIPTLELQLQPGGEGSGVGRPTAVAMPTGAQYIDSSAFVTYWQSDAQTAISY